MFEKPGKSHSIPFKPQASSLISCVSNHSIESRAGENVCRNRLDVIGDTYTGHEACKTASAI